jgi:hypothetical protein
MELTTKKRNRLPASQFADPANRAYLIFDKSHADNAMSRLAQQRSHMSPARYAAIHRRIRAAQARFGEVHENPLPHQGLLLGLGALAAVGVAYAVYTATKAPAVASVTTAPSGTPATGATNPVTNLVVFNRFTDTNLSNLTVPDVTTGVASKTVWVQVFGGGGGNAYTVQVGGVSLTPGATGTLWYGQIQGGAVQQTAFMASDVSGISADGGQTWVTTPAAAA